MNNPVKNIFGVWLITAVVVFAALPATAHPRRSKQKYYGMLEYRFPFLTKSAPVSNSTSFDVFIAHEQAELSSQHPWLTNIDNIIDGMNYGDSIKLAAKYFYEIADCDPVTYYRWTRSDPSEGRKIGVGYFGVQLWERILDVYPDSARTAILCSSDYIADVVVNRTMEGVDSSSPNSLLHPVRVTCTVLDSIKGKVFPQCIPYGSSPAGTLHRGSKHKNNSGACLQFEYALEWQPYQSISSDVFLGGDNALGNIQTGARWVELDSEYIVFLEFVYLGNDSAGMYCSLYPGVIKGSCGGMYPVRGGIVNDPKDDFGFGVGLTTDQFKAALRKKIFSITHPS